MRDITALVNKRTISSGEVAKRLCSGLQSRLDGFDSRPRLQIINARASFEARFVLKVEFFVESNLVFIELQFNYSAAAYQAVVDEPQGASIGFIEHWDD